MFSAEFSLQINQWKVQLNGERFSGRKTKNSRLSTFFFFSPLKINTCWTFLLIILWKLWIWNSDLRQEEHEVHWTKGKGLNKQTDSSEDHLENMDRIPHPKDLHGIRINHFNNVLFLYPCPKSGQNSLKTNLLQDKLSLLKGSKAVIDTLITKVQPSFTTSYVKSTL